VVDLDGGMSVSCTAGPVVPELGSEWPYAVSADASLLSLHRVQSAAVLESDSCT